MRTSLSISAIITSLFIYLSFRNIIDDGNYMMLFMVTVVNNIFLQAKNRKDLIALNVLLMVTLLGQLYFIARRYFLCEGLCHISSPLPRLDLHCNFYENWFESFFFFYFMPSCLTVLYRLYCLVKYDGVDE